jgi:dihydrolipoamide dehydrogenase
METRTYQAVVIGAGPGGYPCAIRLAQLGVKTLCIEKEYWGGVCLNVGCIPSKALITAGKRVEEIAHADKMGINVSGETTVDFEKMIAWKDGIVKRLTGGVTTLFKGNGVDQLFGHARFAGPGKLDVETSEGTVRVEAEHIVIATGSRPIQVPGFSFADPRVLDSTKALALKEIPKKLAVIGGGYIGLEMGMMFRKLGSEVTVIEMQDQVLPGFDPDVVRIISRTLKKQKIAVKLKARALGWEEAGDFAALSIETAKGTETIEADYILVTVGRFPNTEEVGLDSLQGLEMDGRFVKIDKQCKTSVPGVYAIGDVAGQPMLAHKATHEGEVCAEVIGGHHVQNDARTVPAVVFTDPEIATAGMQEPEAREKGYNVAIGKFPFAANGRAMTTLETDGFVKVITDPDDYHRVLGITIVGPHASDLISEAALAVEMEAEALDIGLTIHPHPTLGEAVMEAAKHARKEAVHIMNN